MTRTLCSALLALGLFACNGDSTVRPDSATLDPEIASLKISFPPGVDPQYLKIQAPTIVSATVVDIEGKTVESGIVRWSITEHPEDYWAGEYSGPYVEVIDVRKATLNALFGCDRLTASIDKRNSAGTVEATTTVCGS